MDYEEITLPTGEAAYRYPDGSIVLAPTRIVAEELAVTEEARAEESVALAEQLQTAVEEKRERQQAGIPVPPDKSAI